VEINRKKSDNLKTVKSFSALHHGDLLVEGSWRVTKIYRFRQGEVPGDLRQGGKKFTWVGFRSFKYVGKRRAESPVVDSEVEFRIRKRAFRIEGLPADPWEDYPRHWEKNWKRYRKTKYKKQSVINRNIHSPAFWVNTHFSGEFSLHR
jgi:hypothetical protein